MNRSRHHPGDAIASALRGRVLPQYAVDKPIERVTIKVRENVTVDAAGKEHRRPVPMTLARIRFVE